MRVINYEINRIYCDKKYLKENSNLIIKWV